MSGLPDDTAVYLAELDRVVDAARLDAEAVQLRRRRHEHTPWPGRFEGVELSAANRPCDVLSTLTGSLLLAEELAAEATYRRMVAWYARAATAVLAAVVAGNPAPTAEALERDILWRPGMADRFREWPDWGGEEPPVLPPLDRVLTGRELLDERLRRAHAAVRSTWASVGEVQDWERLDAERAEDPDSPPGLAEHEVARMHAAMERAATLPDALAEWADAADSAASAVAGSGVAR